MINNKLARTAKELIQNSINSNRVYGTAIFERGAIEVISFGDNRFEAWVGGLSGKVIEGGGTRRRVEFVFSESGLAWNCTGNPKNHQIFCKHCVALALYLNKDK